MAMLAISSESPRAFEVGSMHASTPETAQTDLSTGAVWDDVASSVSVDGESCVALGFDEGLFSGLDARGEKHVRHFLFGANNEIFEILRSQAPTLELDVDFKAGKVVARGTGADLARALPQVYALVNNLHPELERKLSQIRGRMAAEARAEQLIREREQQARRPLEISSVPATGEVQSYLDFHKAVLQKRESLPPAPVPQTLLELQRSHFQGSGDLVEVLSGRCWVVPGVLTARECEQWIFKAQSHGMKSSKIEAARHNSRTSGFADFDMAQLVWSRLPGELQREVEATAPETAVCNVHEQWRISRYEPGQFFRAHYDESYTRGKECSGGKFRSNQHGEHGETSSHTLLLILSDGFVKGATRFWPTGKYDEAVDVIAPQGSMLVFEQRSLLHEGCCLEEGVKFVAQGALMRAPTRSFNRFTPTFDAGFRFGPDVPSDFNPYVVDAVSS